jgi:hypothetical protein
MDAVVVQRDVAYRKTDMGPLTMDLYYPSGTPPATGRPAVIFVTGFSDPGAQRMMGRRFKDMGSFTSWGQLAARSGLIGITYENHEPADVRELVEFVEQNAAHLGIKARRLGIWSCSGHAPNALSLLMDKAPHPIRCAVLAYPYTLDLDGAAAVAKAAEQFRFVTPAAGKSLDAFPRDLPIFIARAGKDEMPGLNVTLDTFVARALSANLSLTVVNHAEGPHAFDLFDDSQTSRQIVSQMLAFLRLHLE